jgi:sterol desaturase/sphingolipid hydroxylase (fatty acid hydroxylase superfamily)
MIHEGSLSGHKDIISAGLLCFFIILLTAEHLFPLRLRKRPFTLRFIVNLCITAIAFGAGAVVVRPVALALAEWVLGHHFGLVINIPLPGVVQVGLGFILMDASFYYWHRANHEIPLLWRFHRVHHVDPDMDVSTAFRFHFGEVLYSTGFRAVQVVLLGIIPLTYLIYEIVFQCANMFHHSNLRLPVRLERWLNMVIVTPRMHGIHHSQIRKETDSNYSVVFRCWDWLHRTLRLDVPQESINIGVKGYQQKEDNQLWSLLIMPFCKRKNKMDATLRKAVNNSN